MSVVFLKNSLKCLNQHELCLQIITVNANDNPHILSGNIAHGGVALLWKRTIDDDSVTPLENIESDRIVGIRCDISNCDPLFILSVYLPSSNSTIDEFKEYIDFL